MITVLLSGRNDSYGYNLHKRAVLNVNCIAEVLTDPEDEILFVDIDSPDDVPTFPEAVQDILTPKARRLLRILRIRPEQHARLNPGAIGIGASVYRNIAIRRSNANNRWILSTTTDLIAVPVSEEASLSQVVSSLPDGYYGLPRFELPEALWESLDRMDPHAAITSLRRWGCTLRLNEVVQHSNPYVQFDGPGDFQLMLRHQIHSINGFHEGMSLAWHNDSNLAKRLGLLNGGARSLTGDLHVFHCNHSRQGTPHHSLGAPENDWNVYVEGVTTPFIPEQAEKWGAPDEPIEEVRLPEGKSAISTVLEEVISPLATPTIVERMEFNRSLFYDAGHALPHVANHIAALRKDADIAYVGSNVETLRLVGEFRRKSGHTGRMVFDDTLVAFTHPKGWPPLPSNCISACLDQCLDSAELVLFDLGLGDLPQLKHFAESKTEVPVGDLMSFKEVEYLHWMLQAAFARTVDHELARLQHPGRQRRKLLFVGIQHTLFEPLVAQHLDWVLEPWGTNVRHGYVRPSALEAPASSATVSGSAPSSPGGSRARSIHPPSSEDYAAATRARMGSILRRPDPVPPDEFERAAIDLKALVSSPDIAGYIDTHRDDLTPTLLALLESRLERARAEGDKPLAENLGSLLDILRQQRHSTRLRPLLRLPSGPVGPAAEGTRLCKVCSAEDWENPGWLSILDQSLSEGRTRNYYLRHRKQWENTQLLFGMEKLGMLRADARAVDVGAGCDRLLWALADRIEKVVATDIYGDPFADAFNSSAEMLIHPERLVPFNYRQDHLQVLRMDGRRLEFADNSFDFAFSVSSIEHFGGHRGALESVREMARVVKPGGYVALATELVLNGVRHEEFFLPDEIASDLVEPSGLHQIEDIDFSLSDSTLDAYVDFFAGYEKRPHLVLRQGHVLFTSVVLFLEKPRKTWTVSGPSSSSVASVESAVPASTLPSSEGQAPSRPEEGSTASNRMTLVPPVRAQESSVELRERPFTVGVDARTLCFPSSTARGIGHYTVNHLSALIAQTPHWRYTLLVEDLDQLQKEQLSLLERFSNVQARALDDVGRDEIDLFHITDPMSLLPGYDSPLRLFPRIPTTVVFYDLIPLLARQDHFDRWETGAKAAYLSRLRQLRGSGARILTISENSRLDLNRFADIPLEEMTAIMGGLNTRVGTEPRTAEQVDRTLAAHNLARPFFMVVGMLDPHKGFETTLGAFATVQKELSAQLVVVGSLDDVWKQRWNQVVQENKIPGVVFTGFLPREELEDLYSAAAALVFPSKYEGFGFPVLEAMARGCPVITSNVSSIPEVAGDAAILIPPDNPAEVAKAMVSLARDGSLRRELATRGLSQAAKFTWDKVARKTIGAILQILPPDVLRRAESLEPAGEGHKAAPSVRWVADVFSFSGYARLTRDAIPVLDGRGVRVSLKSLSRGGSPIQLGLKPEEQRTLQKLIDTRVEEATTVCFHVPTLWDGTDVYRTFREALPGAPAYVGITMFETDRLPSGWAEACNQMDEIWVPCRFNRESFARAGVDPERIQVVPFGMDAGRYDPSTVRPMDIPGRRGFAFLSTFQWNKRKGWDVLLQAYLSAFTAEDDVCLVLRSYPDRIKTPTIRERIDQYVRQLGHDPARIPAIILLEEFLSDEQMPALYAAADAFVLPTRGEGWGIPFMEAMASALPTIGTRWSSHLDFMNDENSYLIDVEGLVPVDPEQTVENPFYTPDQQWAEPSVTHTAALMRHVFQNVEEARARGARARQDVVQHWSLDRTANWIAERVAHLNTDKPAFHRTEARQLQTTEPKSAGAATAQPRPVLWHGPIYDPSGYADEARHFLLNLRELGVQVAARPIGRHSELFRAQLDLPTQQALDAVLAEQVRPGFISVVHFPAYAFKRLPQAAYNVGRVMYETDGLPADWVARCNEMDELWVPTDFNLETFRRAGVTSRLVKVPGGIDTERFRPGLEPLPIPGAHGTLFLSIFEWLYRKGWDVLLRAWAKAFRPTDDVTLVIRSYPANVTDVPNVKQEIESRIDHFLREALGLTRDQVAPIVVLGEQIPEQDMPRLIAAAHAYVGPSRGEGWGRPQMEAMACGLPVIATRWSGNLEFMNDENSLLIDVEGLVAIDERAEYASYHGQRWAEPSVDHLAALLRKVVEQPEEMARIVRQARRDVEERWDWKKITAIAASRLAEIQSELGQRQVGLSRQGEKSLAIRWEGSQFVHHSMALVNRELCLQLIEGGQELSLIPYEPDQFSPASDPRFSKLPARVGARLSGPADVHIRHQWPPNFEAPDDGHWVMIQPWEFGSIPRMWIETMREQVDEVWVPTSWVRECYIESGLPAERVHVVPNGVDTSRFRPDVKPLMLNTKKRFKLLFVGGTIGRKGPDVLLDGYINAFSAQDDVCLVIKDMGGKSFYRGQTAEETIRKIQAHPDAPEILYLTEDMPDSDLPGLYTACDCLVHPYRGEGFGLPIAEAMACGLPVIVTGAGACLDFCDESVAYLIPAGKTQLPEKRIGRWETVDTPYFHEPDRPATARLMRHVFEHQEEARVVGARAAQRIRERFTWRHVAERATERMLALRERPILRFQRAAQPAVSAVLHGHGDPDKKLWESLVANNARPMAIVAAGLAKVAPEGSERPDGWRLEESELPTVRLLNRALQAPGDEPVLLLSSDLVFTESWMERLLEAMRRDPGTACAAPASNRAPKPQRVTARYEGTGKELRRYASRRAKAHAGQLEEVAYLGSFCLAFNRAIYREIGPLQEDLELPLALWDYFTRVRNAGYKLAVALDAYVHHDRLADEEGARYDELAATQEAMDRALAEGEAALQGGDLEAAAAAFAGVADQYPDLAAGHAALATTLLALDRVEEALPALRRAAELAPHAGALHNQLGVALFRTGDLEGAEVAFRDARRADPGDLQPLMNLIDLYRSQDRYEEATQALKDAVAIDPNHPEVQSAFATLCLELGDVEGAAMAVQRLEATQPEHPDLDELKNTLRRVSAEQRRGAGAVDAEQVAGGRV